MPSAYPPRFLSIAPVLLACSAAPAFACSDLPNICAAQMEHHRQMLDYGETARQMRIRADEEERYRREQDDVYDATDAPRRPRPPDDPMRERLKDVLAMAAKLDNDPQAAARLDADPRAKRYREGGWDFFQDSPAPVPGEYCAAFWWKRDGLVRISGPGGEHTGALITFWGEGIPRPSAVERIRVTLEQTGEAPQTVQAFNYRLPGEAYGAIALAVPSIDAALAGMEDVHHFVLKIEGRQVAAVDWTDGHAARDRLRACVDARTAARSQR